METCSATAETATSAARGGIRQMDGEGQSED
jgi:hypothetical protein